METTIKTKVSLQVLQKVFENSEKVNIRFFKPASGYPIEKKDANKAMNFYITIRHNESENPINLFNNAIKI